MSCLLGEPLPVLHFVLCLTVRLVVGLNETDIFRKVPWILSEFQQIVTFSETTLSQLEGSILNGTSLMATSVSAIKEPGRFTGSFDTPCTLTAIILSGSNESSVLKLVRELLIFPKEKNATDLEEFIHSSFPIIIWPTVLSRTNEDEFVSEFKRQNFSVPLDADVLIVTENTENSISLWETYSVKGIEILHKINANASAPFILWDLIKYKWMRRDDFYGATIVATGAYDPIYEAEVNFTMHSNGTAELFNGMAVHIYRTFRDLLNFTESAVAAEYIGEDSYPKLLGMDTHLQRGDADIAITQSGVSEDKSVLVALLHATNANWLEARISQEPTSNWKFFLSPFDINVWALIILHVTIMIACATLYRRIVGTDDELAKCEPGNTRLSYFQLDFLWALGTLCQQGWYEWPHKTPFRVLFLVASVTGFLLNAAYSGTITSQLSVRDPISLTFEKLVNLSFLFFMENDFSFPVDPDKYPNRIRITTLYDFNDSSKAMTSLFKVKSALISYPEFFYSVIQHDKKYTDAAACEQFTVIKVSTVPNLCSMAVKKRSPLKEVFNIKILYMWERGVLPRMNIEYKSNTQLRCEHNNHVLDPQTVGELFMAYLIIITGIIASAVFLLMEIMCEIFKQSSILHSRQSTTSSGIISHQSADVS